jgi:hypothetical protein
MDYVITIPDYIEKVKISDKRRAKFFGVNDDLPKKYQTEQYTWDSTGSVLIDKETGKKAIKNSVSAGKERFWKINGQDLWSGMDPHLRSKVAKEMKMYFYEYFRGLTIDSFPIGVELTFYDKENILDIDNLSYIYTKVILDAMCGNVVFRPIEVDGKTQHVPDYQEYPQIIPNDNVQFVNHIASDYVISDERKLIIKIFKN